MNKLNKIFLTMFIIGVIMFVCTNVQASNVQAPTNVKASISGANKVYDAVTDYQSIFTLPINLAKGQYEALCTYNGILQYDDSSASMTFAVV